ncbi:MAG: DUF4159 domain-containing protein [Rhodobacteraceae bacterium]|nr:DUF4159 domain-containing protein [Paracoccaceae bacterium]
MTILAGIGFTSPWLLLALLGLPLLWLLLRAVPPAPIRRAFPAVTLLLGLKDDESVSDRTPWWLLLLRMLIVALVILGLAGPVLNPVDRAQGDGPLLIVMDASWAGADGWDGTVDRLSADIADAGRAGRTVAVLRLGAPQEIEFLSANAWRSRVPGLVPQPWQPSQTQIERSVALIDGIEGGFDTLWISDGLDYDGRQQLVDAVMSRGDLRVVQAGRPVIGLMPARFVDGQIVLSARRAETSIPQTATVLAIGTDPGGVLRTLASVDLAFEAGETESSTELVLPTELRARIVRFELQNRSGAGAVALTDDNLRRREVALIAGRENREGLQLLSPHHYLRQALVPTADLLNGTIADMVPANPDVIVLADIARMSPANTEMLTEWVEEGGLLLRFAGPRLAASEVSREEEDPLMPVRLRSGGRSVGGAMSWGEPKTLAPFRDNSPFFGLTLPTDVTVTSQVVAQPDPSLADRVIAELSDGTPLVTRKEIGQGQVVLFHVTANAEWSSLPLSGLFVDMLERLAISTSAHVPNAEDLTGTTWTPVQVLDGFGSLRDAGTLPGVEGPDLATLPLGPDLQPGLYESEDRRLARNVLSQDSVVTAASWPLNVPVEGAQQSNERPIGGGLLSLALVLLMLDILASLMLSGRLTMARVAIAVALLLPGVPSEAQEPDPALTATSELVLAHVLTGNKTLDDTAYAGLMGLSDTLYFRTSVEPANPVGVDLERDELAFFPLLYWPITPDQPTPSDEAYDRLNAYLRAGGMIVFDTRDANIAGFGTSSPNGRKLQALAGPLDIPPLEPLPADHVLTRTFYLLQDFPGRHARGQVWVEAAPPDAEQIEGMPFRNLNDGVTPILIGGNDWAAAWAVDSTGRALLPVGRGYSGERQRELAYRFGVNLVMHVLTGNYKSDQVHVPALLDRLGQ